MRVMRLIMQIWMLFAMLRAAMIGTMENGKHQQSIIHVSPPIPVNLIVKPLTKYASAGMEFLQMCALYKRTSAASTLSNVQ